MTIPHIDKVRALYEGSSLVYYPLEDILLPYELEIISNCPFMGKSFVYERYMSARWVLLGKLYTEKKIYSLIFRHMM